MTTIFKLGGSLLNLPTLAEDLHAVLRQKIRQSCLIVVGGGAAADVVRDWSQIHALDDEAAHWLAIASLDLNRKLLERLTGFRSIASREQARQLWEQRSEPLLLDVASFLAAEEAEVGQVIPHNWDVTSDSIAAWITIRWPADELVLVKSVPVPKSTSAVAAAVDTYFAQLTSQVPQISWCDLRSSAAIATWLNADEPAMRLEQMNQND